MPEQVDLSRHVVELCESIAALWIDPDFPSAVYRSPYNRRKRAQTTASADATLLPRTGRPVRGTEGVDVEASDRKPTRWEAVEALLSESFAEQRYEPSTPLSQNRALVRQRLSSLREAVDQDTALAYRLFDTLGYKTFSVEQMETHRAQQGRDSITDLWISMLPLLSDALVELNFDPAHDKATVDWTLVASSTVTRLRELAEKSSYPYEVRIFLNGPPVDSLEDLHIAECSIGGEPVEVTLAYATDELLDPLVDYTVLDAFRKTNTVLRYRTSIAVETNEQPYLQKYADASKIAELFVDLLRLIRCNDDIGVLALEIIGLDDQTPTIRKTWADRYQPALAPFLPKRFDFAASPVTPLTEQEIGKLRQAVVSVLGVQGQFKGLMHALRRFGSSVERYSRSDPERVLEYAIALESIYLNDQGEDRGELLYRLRIRAARFLASGYSERMKIFNTLRDLYDMRSRVAHGASLENLKSKERKKLDSALEGSPQLIAQSVFRILEMPANAVHKGDTTEFWRRVELGDLQRQRTGLGNDLSNAGSKDDV